MKVSVGFCEHLFFFLGISRSFLLCVCVLLSREKEREKERERKRPQKL